MSDTSGPTSPVPLAHYDRDSSCWRTSQVTFLSDSTPSSVTLPSSGSMRSGALYERATLGPAIVGRDCSSLLGTPTAHERTHSPRPVHHGVQLANQVATLPTPTVSDANGVGAHGDVRTTISLLPTPAAQEPGGTLEQYHDRLRKADGREPTFVPLGMLVQLLPTPTRRDWKGENQRHDETCLPGAVRSLLPTPTAADSFGARNKTSGRSNPESEHHDGTTLTDWLWLSTGASTNRPSADTKPCSDDESQPPLWTDGS